MSLFFLLSSLLQFVGKKYLRLEGKVYTVKHKSAQVRPDESTPESPQALNAEAVVSDLEVRCLRVGFFVWNRLTSLIP